MPTEGILKYFNGCFGVVKIDGWVANQITPLSTSHYRLII